MSLMARRLGAGAAFTPVAGFLPSDVAGLHAWYDSIDAFSGLGLTPGGTITTWPPRASFGPNMSQGNADKRPRYVEAGYPWAPEPAVFFNGAGSSGFRDVLLPSPSQSLIPETGPWTVFFAFEHNTSATHCLLAQWGSSTGLIIWLNSSNVIQVYLGTSGAYAGGTKLLTTTTLTPAAGNTYVVAIRRDGLNFDAWVDGTLEASDSSDADPNRPIIQTVSRLGARLISGSNEAEGFIGDMGSFLVYHAALASGDRGAVEAYLANRFA